ncbi:MAG: lipid A deacylase LpxR family protein, partial [Pseudomonadota bacterium]
EKSCRGVNIKKSIGCWAIICATAILNAADRDDSLSRSLIIQWDNDLLTGTDRNYTNGARIAYVSELKPDSKADNFLRNTLAHLSGLQEDSFLPDHRFRKTEEVQFHWGTGLTQLMYTPEDPNAATAPDGERPYAGWLGLEFTLYANTYQSANSVTLSIGTTGENSFAEEAQEWVHTNISGSPIFQGWDSQVPGEATINLHFDRKQRIGFLDAESRKKIQIDGYYEWGAAIGNFRTDAYLGSLVRLGYNLPEEYTMPRVQLGSSGHILFNRRGKNFSNDFSILTFAGVRAYGVLHDITLDGPVFRDFDTGVDSEPLVGEVIVGFNLRWKALEASLSHTIRTDEFAGQRENLEFGSVMARLSGKF